MLPERQSRCTGGLGVSGVPHRQAQVTETAWTQVRCHLAVLATVHGRHRTIELDRKPYIGSSRWAFVSVTLHCPRTCPAGELDFHVNEKAKLIPVRSDYETHITGGKRTPRGDEVTATMKWSTNLPGPLPLVVLPLYSPKIHFRQLWLFYSQPVSVAHIPQCAMFSRSRLR